MAEKESIRPKKDPILDKFFAREFFISVLILLAVTVWAIYDEVITRRPWKKYQKDFKKLASAIIEEKIALAKTQIETSEFKELEKKYKYELEKFENNPEKKQLESEIILLNEKIDKLRKKFQEKRALWQATVYKYEHSIAPETKEKYKKLLEEYENGTNEEKGFLQLASEMEVLENELKTKKEKLKNLAEKKEFLESKLLNYQKQYLDLVAFKESIKKEPIEIKQVYNNELKIIDRCESCHIGIRKKILEDTQIPQPFKSHPNVFIKEVKSPAGMRKMNILDVHPVEIFGCTPCHQGQGYALNTVDKAHGIDEFWLKPLLKGDFIQSSCYSCHKNEYELLGAPLLSQGKRLFRDLACWGCHNLKGITDDEEELFIKKQQLENVEHKIKFDTSLTNRQREVLLQEQKRLSYEVRELAKEVKMLGPSLAFIRSKTTPEWLIYWVNNPRNYRHNTKMPDIRIFDFSNNETETNEKIEAIVSFLVNSSKEIEVKYKSPEKISDTEIVEGKKLFNRKGCLGCHKVDGKGSDFAPDLSRIGEKVNYNYLVQWLQEPKKFQPRATMPSLRLSEKEAEAITIYLSTLKEETLNERSRKFLNDSKKIERGKSLVTLYGCAGCHEINSIPLTKIGSDLSAFSSKTVHELDFGLLKEKIKEENHIKNRHQWNAQAKQIFIKAKLLSPRIFDTGKYKKESEKLRMPYLNLSEEQIRALSVFVMAQTGEEPPLRYTYNPHPDVKSLFEGQNLVAKYNCSGCHRLEWDKILLKDDTIFEGIYSTKDEDEELYFFDITTKTQRTEYGKGNRLVIPFDDVKDLQISKTGEIISLLIEDYVSTQDKTEAGARTMIPPYLVGEGKKVQPEWFFNFLIDPYQVRPWIDSKMPTFDFSEREAEKIVKYFSVLDDEKYPYEFIPEKTPVYFEIKNKLDPEHIEGGKKLVESELTKCWNCHIRAGKINPKATKEELESLAPDMILTKNRLKPAWIVDWLKNPQKIQPGTKMPTFKWGKDYESVFNRTAENQIDAVKDYLMQLKE